MNLKTLAKANVLQEKIENLTRVLDAVKNPTSKFDIWVKSQPGDELSINEFLPMDIKTDITQASRSAIEIELKRLISQFDAL